MLQSHRPHLTALGVEHLPPHQLFQYYRGRAAKVRYFDEILGLQAWDQGYQGNERGIRRKGEQQSLSPISP